MIETVHVPAEQFAWELKALCRQAPDTFFPNHANESAEPAKAICRRCPVQAPCLKRALDENQPYGIWGGLTTRERRRLLKRRRLLGETADPT